jgi:hypothetical protein
MITELIKNYIKLKFEKIIERYIDKVSSFASVLIGILFLILSCLLFFLFSTFALALSISEYLGKNYWGFLIISLFYLFVGIVFWLLKNTFVKRPLSKTLTKAFKGNFDLTSQD